MTFEIRQQRDIAHGWHAILGNMKGLDQEDGMNGSDLFRRV